MGWFGLEKRGPYKRNPVYTLYPDFSKRYSFTSYQVLLPVTLSFILFLIRWDSDHLRRIPEWAEPLLDVQGLGLVHLWLVSWHTHLSWCLTICIQLQSFQHDQVTEVGCRGVRPRRGFHGRRRVGRPDCGDEFGWGIVHAHRDPSYMTFSQTGPGRSQNI